MQDYQVEFNDDFGRSLSISDTIITDAFADLRIKLRINNTDLVVKFTATTGETASYKRNRPHVDHQKEPVVVNIDVTTGACFDEAISENHPIEIWEADGYNYSFKFVFEPIKTISGRKARLYFNVVRRYTL